MRCFVAFDIGEEARDFLYRLQKKLGGEKFAKVSWVHKKNLHLTLKFLGEVDEGSLAEIRHALSQIRHSKFSLKLNGLGTFPELGAPRVVWVGLEPEEEAIKLQQKIDEALILLAPAEQRFTAHLTIGRVKFIKRRPEFVAKLKEAVVERIPFEVTSFKLMRSDLKREGPEYSVVEEYELA